MFDCLPKEMIASIIRQLETSKQLCTTLQLSKSWRGALTCQEVEEIWEHWVRRDYPRAVDIVSLSAEATCWRDMYRDQQRAQAAVAVNSTEMSVDPTRRLDSFIFAVELLLDGEIKASWTGKGREISFHEYTRRWREEDDCFLTASLWKSSPPEWYSEVVSEQDADGWNGRLQLTMFVSGTTNHGLRTGKLFSCDHTYINGDGETDFLEPPSSSFDKSFISVNALMFAAEDENSGRVDFSIEESFGTVYPSDSEPVGNALARMIGQALH